MKDSDETFPLNPHKFTVLQVKTQNSFIWNVSLPEMDDICQIQPTPIWTMAKFPPELHESREEHPLPRIHSLFFLPTRTRWAPPWFPPDTLHVFAGLAPQNPSSISNSAAATAWSMIPLIITATLSPLSHHPNWHSQGQLSADCLHRLGLH